MPTTEPSATELAYCSFHQRLWITSVSICGQHQIYRLLGYGYSVSLKTQILVTNRSCIHSAVKNVEKCSIKPKLVSHLHISNNGFFPSPRFSLKLVFRQSILAYILTQVLSTLHLRLIIFLHILHDTVLRVCSPSLSLITIATQSISPTGHLPFQHS